MITAELHVKPVLYRLLLFRTRSK